MVSLKDGLVCNGGQAGHLLYFLQHLPYLYLLRALSELVSLIHLIEITKKMVSCVIVSFSVGKMIEITRIHA